MNKKYLLPVFLLVIGVSSCTDAIHADVFNSPKGDKYPGEKIQENLNIIREKYHGVYKMTDGIYDFESTSCYFDNLEKINVEQTITFTGNLVFDSSEIAARANSFIMERKVNIFDDSGTLYTNYTEGYKFKNNKYIVDKNGEVLNQKYVDNFMIDFSYENEINDFNYEMDFKEGNGKYKFVDINFARGLVNFAFIYNKTNDYDLKQTKFYLNSQNYKNCEIVNTTIKQNMLSDDKNHFINNSSNSRLKQDFNTDILDSLIVDIDESSSSVESMNINLNLGGKLYEENL